MSEEDRKWLEQLIEENKESNSELTYTYCPFSVLYALQQENQQLKEQLKDENNYHNEAVKWYEEAFDIEQERIKYKSVLDEIRKYIDEFIIYVDEDGEVYFKEEFRTEYNDLLEILDKVGKE